MSEYSYARVSTAEQSVGMQVDAYLSCDEVPMLTHKYSTKAGPVYARDDEEILADDAQADIRRRLIRHWVRVKRSASAEWDARGRQEPWYKVVAEARRVWLCTAMVGVNQRRDITSADRDALLEFMLKFEAE